MASPCPHWSRCFCEWWGTSYKADVLSVRTLYVRVPERSGSGAQGELVDLKGSQPDLFYTITDLSCR